MRCIPFTQSRPQDGPASLSFQAHDCWPNEPCRVSMFQRSFYFCDLQLASPGGARGNVYNHKGHVIDDGAAPGAASDGFCSADSAAASALAGLL